MLWDDELSPGEWRPDESGDGWVQLADWTGPRHRRPRGRVWTAIVALFRGRRVRR